MSAQTPTDLAKRQEIMTVAPKSVTVYLPGGTKGYTPEVHNDAERETAEVARAANLGVDAHAYRPDKADAGFQALAAKEVNGSCLIEDLAAAGLFPNEVKVVQKNRNGKDVLATQITFNSEGIMILDEFIKTRFNCNHAGTFVWANDDGQGGRFDNVHLNGMYHKGNLSRPIRFGGLLWSVEDPTTFTGGEEIPTGTFHE